MEEIAHTRILRIFRLIRRLKNKPYPTLSQLASLLECSEKTVRRYLSLIEEIGFCWDQRPENNTYFLLEDAETPFVDKTAFTAEEAQFLSAILANATLTADVSKQIAYKLYANSELSQLPATLINLHQAQIAITLRTAMQQMRQTKLYQYYSANSNTFSDRIVEPLNLHTQYFEAYEPQSRKVKKFKFERVGKIIILNKIRTYKGEGLQEDLFKMSGDTPIPVKLHLQTAAYYLLIEEFPAAKPYLTAHPDYYTFEGIIYDYRGIGRFILGLPGLIEIVEPVGLREYVAGRIAQFKL